MFSCRGRNPKRVVLTISIAHKDDKVLLGFKKRGLGKGLWNGTGGHKESGETVEETVKREGLEEFKIKILRLQKLGYVEFGFKSDPDTILEAYIFKILEFEGEPQETDEMRPKWFREEKIPLDKMWGTDRYWFSFFLQRKKFRGFAFLKTPKAKKSLGADIGRLKNCHS